jgi:uncharacterized repeat protein (TIGR01451 family)
MGDIDDYHRETTVLVEVMELSVNKTADPNIVSFVKILTYTLAHENMGSSEANNVNITDKLAIWWNEFFLGTTLKFSHGHMRPKRN